MMVSVIVPIYNILAVTTLEVFRGGKPDPVNILRKLATNPLILGAAAGIIAVLGEIKLPSVLETVVSDMSAGCNAHGFGDPGCIFQHHQYRKVQEKPGHLCHRKTDRRPGGRTRAAAFFGFRGIAFVTLIAIFASPTAVSSFTMAETMESDSELAGNCVVFSSAFACFTMFFWIFLYKNLGMF